MSLPASQHHKRHGKRWHYEKPLPGQQAQIDVKSIVLLKNGPCQLHDGRAAGI